MEPGSEEVPALNRYEKEAARKLQVLLDVPLSLCEDLVHDIVLASIRGPVDVRRRGNLSSD